MKFLKKVSFLVVSFVLTLSFSSCGGASSSVYYSKDLQMETLKGKVEKVDFSFYKDPNGDRRYGLKQTYQKIYDNDGTLIYDTRLGNDPINPERNEDGYIVRYGGLWNGEMGEWNMCTFYFEYDENGFVKKEQLCADFGWDMHYSYVDSMPDRAMISDGDRGYLYYLVLETDEHDNWTLMRVTEDYVSYNSMAEQWEGNNDDVYFVRRDITYSSNE